MRGTAPPLVTALIVALGVSGISGGAAARDALGMFNTWAAFRDDKPRRCFAIAAPVARSAGKWRPFATVSHWPEKRIRGQFHARLSRERRDGAPVLLTFGEATHRLTSGRYDAWAASPREDAAILARMRAARTMRISSTDQQGRPFSDSYMLKGAATAIDAAALGCTAP